MVANKSDIKSQDEYWEKEMTNALKRLGDFHRQGDKVIEKFKGKSGGTQTKLYAPTTELNLFNSNVTTLRSLLFGSTPKVDVKRRFFDPNDDVARVASLIFSRVLNSNVEDPSEDFTAVLRSSLDDRLLPGLGTARVRYVVNNEKYEDNGEIAEKFVSEDCVIDYVHWRDFVWGWSRNWKGVPWVAFRTWMTKEQTTEKFGEEKARQLEYKTINPNTDENRNSEADEKSDPWGRAEVYEIWCKETGKVHWYSHDAKKVLDEQEDPLELKNFFPCPMPMMANATTSLFIPVADFMMAQDLYDEIDKLETRIVKITEAIKVVGVYDKGAQGVKSMLTEGTENELIPVDNWARFAEKGGLEGAIDWMPIEELAATLERLRSMRDEAINLLYQTTGLSDILRGAATQTGVSATEQALKAKFGSVRVQALQDTFAIFATELQKIRAEVICKHFEDSTIIGMSNLGYHTDNVELVQQALELIRKDPDDWRIQIRPESVAMVDYAQVKAERTEYLTALSTYMQSAQAMLKQAPGAGPFILQLMKWGLAGFKGSNEIEGIVDQAIDEAEKALKQPQQQGPSQEEMKMKLEQQKAEAKMAIDKQKADQDMANSQQKHVLEMQKLMMSFKQDLQLLRAELQGKVAEQNAQIQGDVAKAALAIEQKREEAKNDVD